MTENLNSPEYEIPPELQNQVSITTIDKIYNWGRRSSIWPITENQSVNWTVKLFSSTAACPARRCRHRLPKESKDTASVVSEILPKNAPTVSRHPAFILIFAVDAPGRT